MRIVIDGVEYSVSTRARAWPLLSYLQRLSSPGSLEEAERFGDDLERVVDRILEICVSPRPVSDDHKPRLLLALLRAEDRVVREASQLAENFRV